MASFGKTSMSRLITCERDIQTIFLEVVKEFDCSAISGHRPPEEQFELYKKGRKLVRSEWVVDDKSKIVTYKDGTIKKSKHNFSPSKALDIVPYPIDWNDIDRMKTLYDVVLRVQERLLAEGKIEKTLTWGGYWKWRDYPHYQI